MSVTSLHNNPCGRFLMVLLQKLGLSKRQKILLWGCVAWNYLIYNGSRVLAAGFEHHNLAIFLDYQIPFLPWTVVLYWGCTLFWCINYILGVKYDEGMGFHFVGSHYLGEAICFFLFVLFPTATVRPEVTGNSLAEWCIRITYFCDNPDNLFPSIHCFASWLSWIAVRNKKAVPRWYQITSFFLAVAVCICTLTVKQHVLADVAGGIILAELSYVFSGICDRCAQKKMMYSNEKEIEGIS